MSEPATPRAAKPRTLMGKAVGLPFTVFGVLCASLLLSILVECVGVYFLWTQQGWHHAQAMFYREREQLSEVFVRSLVLSEPVRTADLWLNHVYEWVFVKSGLLELQRSAWQRQVVPGAGTLTFRHYIGVVLGHMQTYLLAAAYTTLTFFVRLLVLVLCMPLILMAVFAGFVDGLVKRDIRRFVVGHESGFVYHRAKALLLPTIMLPWIIYLALPVSISPLLVLLPCAVLAGMVTNIAAASFKKYI
jgi:integrating conjugative element membrane protein (TIGR03747 family)